MYIKIHISRKGSRYIWLLCLVFTIFHQTEGLFFRDRWTDVFEEEMCREKLYRLDWRTMVKPCINRTTFTKYLKTGSFKETTEASRSFISNYDINRAGEYSRLTIQSVSRNATNRTIGGDTWRAFVRGQSHYEPMVYDLQNGVYEISMLFLEPGRYNVDIYLDGTACSSFVDPPPDWFRKAMYYGPSLNSSMYSHNYGWSELLEERLWDPIGGSSYTVEFDVIEPDPKRLKDIHKKLDDWRNICGITQCHFLWDGFGRWINGKWRPFSDDPLLNQPVQHIDRKEEGTLLFYGDQFSLHTYKEAEEDPLCNQIFSNCRCSASWVNRHFNRISRHHGIEPYFENQDISTKKITRHLRTILRRAKLDKKSALIFTFGLDMPATVSFEDFKDIVDSTIAMLKTFEGQVVWRTTSAVWKTNTKVSRRFQNYQRASLFNSYAMAAMCEAGYAILDIFPITSSEPKQPMDGASYEQSVIDPIELLLSNYFIQRNIA